MSPKDPSSALNILCKWRVLLTGWQLGSRAKGDPEGDAVSDHREATLILRAELSALELLLVEKGIFTAEEFSAALEREAAQLSKDLETRFPGVKATPAGLEMTAEAASFMRHWRP